MSKTIKSVFLNSKKSELKSIECVRIIEFDAGHRLLNHEGKCRKLHGHRYKCEFYCSSDKLDKIGRVIDFGVIKEIMGNWIDENLDHNVILNKEDEKLGRFIDSNLDQEVYFLDSNPTAENIARHLLLDIFPKLMIKHKISCKKIRLWETPNCFVEVCK